MDNYKVYKHTFPNGKVYIGITSQPLQKRFCNGNGYRKCPKMYNAILKYGWNNVEHELLYDNLTKPEAEQKEIELIAFYGSVKNGYNSDHGGNVVGTHSIETRQKISDGNKGKTMPPVSIEQRQRLSEMFSGANNPFYGCKHSEDAKIRQSERMKGNSYNKGHHHTEEFKKQKSVEMKAKYSNGGNPKCKAVIKTDKDGNETVYYSLRKAAEDNGISLSTLWKRIKNNIECGDINWRYASEHGA